MFKRLMVAFALAAILTLNVFGADAERDFYKNYQILEEKEEKNIDYKITYKEKNSHILVMGIHGGEIQKGTSEVVKEISKKGNYSLYLFEGTRLFDNERLFVSSVSFDEEKAMDLGRKSKTILAVTGYENELDETILIGGKDKNLIKKIKHNLEKEGFKVEHSPSYFNSEKKENIVNKSKTGKGVEIQLPSKLRKKFFNKTETFQIFTKSIIFSLKGGKSWPESFYQL